MFKKLFGFGSKKEYDLLYTIDLHSHLIPGIDDGVSSLEESIEIISGMKELGFTKLITTPHIMHHRFPNTKEIILSGFKRVKKELEYRKIDIVLEAAAEYYFDEYFLNYIENKSLLTFSDNFVLFEMSYTSKPFGLEQTIFNLLSKEYKPILAHPERYSFLYSDMSKYDKLKNSGVYFQINLNSLLGFYGKKPKQAANYLVDNGMVDFIGSDTHSMKYLQSFEKGIKSDLVERIFENNRIKNDFL